MFRYKLLGALGLLFILSCQKGSQDPVVDEWKHSYIFVGTNNPDVHDDLESRTCIGSIKDKVLPVLWEAGDALGVFRADGTFVGVAELKSEDNGKQVGKFVFNTNVDLTTGEKLYLSYPYDPQRQMTDGKIEARVPSDQIQSVSNSSKGIGMSSMTYAVAEFDGSKTSFTLTHSNAYMRILIADVGEYAGYTFTGVTLWCEGQKLSGKAYILPDDGTISISSYDDYVTASLATPVTFASGHLYSIWLTSLPVDLTDKPVHVIVHMTKGDDTVTLPIYIHYAGNLPSHTVISLQLPKLRKSLAPGWYETVEKSYVAANGKSWSYGEENTSLFYTAGEGKTHERVVDIKARGNFTRVRRPAYVQIQYMSDLYAEYATKQGAVIINGTDATDGTSYVRIPVSADYTVTVNMTSYDASGYCSGMLILDEDGNVLWGLNLWLAINWMGTVQYNNGLILDRNLGADMRAHRTHDYRSNGCYFQWGRPFAFPWSLQRGTASALVDNTMTLEKSASNPYTMYYYSGQPYDWYWGDGNNKDRTGDLDDLWGNPQEKTTDISSVGVKSNQDPCPKGYRVVDPAVLNELRDGIQATIADGVITSTGTTEVNTSGDLYYLLYKDVSWSFGSAFQCSGGVSDLGGREGNMKVAAAYWSNANYNANAYLLWFRIKDTNTIEILQERARGAALPVRCMVDIENR